MPAVSQPADYTYSRSPMESPRYVQLQPVTSDLSIGSLIASSTNMCLPDSAPDACGTPYGAAQHQAYYNYSSDDSTVSPHSPAHSVYEEDLSDIQEVLLPRMTGSRADDDDASVMFDCTDLAFLDHCCRGDDLHVTSNGHTGCPPLLLATETGFYPAATHSQPLPYHSHPHPHHHPSNYASSTPSGVTSQGGYRHMLTTTTTTAANGLSLHYYDTPSVIPYTDRQLTFPPTPSPSPHLRHDVTGHAHGGLRVKEEMEEEDDDDDDAEYKPYCDSRRGAKKNLLWKFLLGVLDHHPDLAQWTDLQRGVFKFVDTARISKLWGQRKHKNDMTFEKLSRGIRHYYKRGLMERMANTRLVYKFNWDKVPKKHRKA